jgi:hypothetical protein
MGTDTFLSENIAQVLWELKEILFGTAWNVSDHYSVLAESYML